MRAASPYAAATGVLLAGVFFVRAATGVPAARAHRLGRAMEAGGRYAEAGPVIDRGAVGADRCEALWRAGRSRLELWDDLSPSDRTGRSGDEALRAGAARFLAARVASPAAAWFIAALSDVYARRESAARTGRLVDLAALDRGPWALVGDDGRIAIGLARGAIAREPNRFELRDQLVLLLTANGLHEEASAAMVESARVLPDFGAHPEFEFESLPRDLVETFWRTSRALDPVEAPLLCSGCQLLASGQLGRRLGHLDEAEHDLRVALSTVATNLAVAESAFHLGLVLFDRGRFDEAETMLARALKEPVFAFGVAQTRARIAEKQERWRDALDQLREVRRRAPREQWVLLEFAGVAQLAKEWDQAEEALRWATVVHPQDPAPRRALVEMYLARGDRTNARRALDEYVNAFGRTDDAARLERALAEPLDPVRS